MLDFFTWIAVVSWVWTFYRKIKKASGWESKVHFLTSAKVLNDGFYLFLKGKWKLKNLDRSKSIYLNWLSKPRTPLNCQIFRGILTPTYSKNSSVLFKLGMLWTFLFVQYAYLFPFHSMSLIFHHLTNELAHRIIYRKIFGHSLAAKVRPKKRRYHVGRLEY